MGEAAALASAAQATAAEKEATAAEKEEEAQERASEAARRTRKTMTHSVDDDDEPWLPEEGLGEGMEQARVPARSAVTSHESLSLDA